MSNYRRIQIASALLLGMMWLTVSWAQDMMPEMAGSEMAGSEMAGTRPPGMPVYELELTLADDLASLQGSQTVTLTNTSNQLWGGVYFHLYPNLLGGEMILREVLQAGLPLEVTLSEDSSLLYVPVLGGLAPEEQTTLQISYDLTIPQRMGRNYGVLALQEGILSLAHAYPTLVVFEEGAWDIDIPVSHGDLLNAAASAFTVSVQAPVDVTVVTTGEVVSEIRNGETQQLEIEAAVARDFYLSASRDYEVITATANIPTDMTADASTRPVIVRSYYQRHDDMDDMDDMRVSDMRVSDIRKQRAQLALDASVVSLELFSSRLVPYPYDEFDIVPMVTTALGLEFPGIIGLSSALYDDTRIGRQASLAYLESTTVHEVVHQWFYNLVGNDQVSEPWLDEATTQYVTWEYFKARYGENSLEADTFLNSLISRSRSSSQQKLGKAVEAYSPRQYSSVIYGEGPLVLDELASLLGEEAFWGFLRTYSRDNRWLRVDTQGFERQLEAYCGCVLDEFFEAYIR